MRNNNNNLLYLMLCLLIALLITALYTTGFIQGYVIKKACLSANPASYTIINPGDDIPEITFKTCPGCNNNIPETRDICPVCNYVFNNTEITPGESENPGNPDPGNPDDPGQSPDPEAPEDNPPSADPDAPPPVEPGTSSLKNTIFIALILFVCLHFFI